MEEETFIWIGVFAFPIALIALLFALSSGGNIYNFNQTQFIENGSNVSINETWLNIFSANLTPDLSAYVPYTGATSNVDLNGKNLSNVRNIKINGSFNQSSQPIFTSDIGLDVDITKNMSGTDIGNYGSIYGANYKTTITDGATSGGAAGFIGEVINQNKNQANIDDDTGYFLGGQFLLTNIGKAVSLTGLEVITTSGGTGSLANLMTGISISNSVNTNNVGTNYGLYISDINRGTSGNYSIFTNTGKVHFGDDVLIHANTKKLLFGASSSSSIYYDGTNMIINPKEVGSGQLKVLGDANITGNTTIAGVLYYETTGACNLALNRSDCTNTTGRYIIG